VRERFYDTDPELRAEAEQERHQQQRSNGSAGVGRARVSSGSGYQMQKVSWVWPGWFARGKLHILGGQKGTGKSTIAFDLLAKMTIGDKFPDGTAAPAGHVLIWSGEDDIVNTILPRFVVAGGDRDRVWFIDGIVIDGVKRSFDPATDITDLLIAARETPELVAVLIDPIVSAMAGDSHKNSETRRGLQPLVDLAIERNVALLGITHFTKGTQGQDPIERITGSLAFGAIPRVVWAAAKGDSEDGPRKLVRIGSNIGKSGGGFEYLLRQDLVPDHDFTAQRVVWGKRLDGSPLELLENSQQQSQKFGAVKLLEEMLANGPVPVTDLQAAARAHSISWPTVERAKKQIGTIVAKRTAAGWCWCKGVMAFDEP
jgi:putative DNA primase/helicase